MVGLNDLEGIFQTSDSIKRKLCFMQCLWQGYSAGTMAPALLAVILPEL